MATKFYRAAGEESDDDDDDRSGSGSEEEDTKKKVAAPAAKPGAKPTKKSIGDRSLKVESSDDEDEREKRKVVSAKEKKMAALTSSIKTMRNALKIGNWVKVLAEWTAIDTHLEKLMKEPEFRKEGVPKVYWQQLLAVDSIIRKQKDDEKKAKADANDDDDSKDSKKGGKPAAPKKMNAEQARAQTRLHAHVKKLMKTYEKQLTEYKKAPLPDTAEEEPKGKGKSAAADEDGDEGDEDEGEAEDDKDAEDEDGDEEEGEGEDDDDDDDVKGAKKGKKEESDDDDWDDDSDDDNTAEAIDLSKSTGKQFTREYWMKKPGAPDSDDEAEKKPKKTAEKRKQGTGKKPTSAVPTTTAEEEQKKKEKSEADFTPEMVLKKLAELVGMRGKKGTDRQSVIADLKLLSTKTTAPAPLLKVYITLCSALFDVTLNTDAHMPIPLWHQANETLLAIIKILLKEPLVRLSEDDTSVEESFETGENEDQKIIERYITTANAQKIEEEKKKKVDEEKKLKDAGQEIQYVMGNLYSFVDRMASEFKKSLQNLDPHAAEYVQRLKDEPLLLQLVERVQEYYFKIGKIAFQCKVVLLRLEHLYYHYSPADDAQRAEALAWQAKKDGKPAPAVADVKDKNIVGSLAKTPFGSRSFLNMANPSQVQTFATFLYKHADDRTRIRALLYHVYYLAIHNRYAEARDLLLMSHVQDGINDLDIHTRIIFNRTMAQLGLCAFRVGEYRHSLYCLMDLYQSKGTKELIAQGTSSRYYGERDLEKEKLEKKRLYPYHMHMSLDMLEAVHLLSAMFIEVPSLAIYGADNKRRVMSKSFRRMLDNHMRQAFNGPPENTRDLIMGATKALRVGEWNKALKYVLRLKMWDLVPNAEFVKSMVTDKIKEEALRTYLVTFASQYVTISLRTLMDTFGLPDNVVYRTISKLMFNEHLQGTWDQPTASIVMHAQELTPLQRSALKYADKASVFLEQNERSGEQRGAGGFGGDGERRTGYGGYGSGYQRAGDTEGGSSGSRPGGPGGYRGGGARGGRLGPAGRMRRGGGERNTQASDD